jgi:hypothetical protein
VTRFQILARNDEHNWNEAQVVEAHSAEAAIRNWYMRHTPENVLAVVAVPERSWKPQQVRVETTKRVVVGEVSEPVAMPEPPSEQK